MNLAMFSSVYNYLNTCLLFLFITHYSYTLKCTMTLQNLSLSINTDKYRDNSLGKIQYLLNSVTKCGFLVETIFHLVYLYFFSKYFCDIFF